MLNLLHWDGKDISKHTVTHSVTMESMILMSQKVGNGGLHNCGIQELLVSPRICGDTIVERSITSLTKKTILVVITNDINHKLIEDRNSFGGVTYVGYSSWVLSAWWQCTSISCETVYFGGQWWVSGIWCQFLNVDMFQMGQSSANSFNTQFLKTFRLLCQSFGHC